MAQKPPEQAFALPIQIPADGDSELDLSQDVPDSQTFSPIGKRTAQGKTAHNVRFDNQVLTPPLSGSALQSAEDERPTYHFIPSDATPLITEEAATGMQYASEIMHHGMDSSMDMLSWPSFPFPSGIRTPRDAMDMSLQAELDFSDFDIRLLETYNTKAPFLFEDYEDPMPSTNYQAFETTTPAIPIATDLRKAAWRFMPNSEDNADSENANLSLPQNNAGNKPESRINVDKRTTAEKLDLAARDKIFGIVLNTTLRTPLSKALSSFPSVELLDSLIQFYLTTPASDASKWIHTASHVPKKTRPELLLAMAAYGAVLAPDLALRKLGFALQEICRRSIAAVWESDNSQIRNLVPSQAYLMQILIGIWSGNSRKMEIAESFEQPILTMLRRGGRFQRSNYPTIILRPEDEGEDLETIWHQWIEQESLKRLVLRLLEYDTCTSMTVFINPLISYADLMLPLPEAESLWRASNAREWKRLYLHMHNESTPRIPSLVECINDPELIETYHKFIDFNSSCSSLLHTLWGLVWEYRQRNLLMKTLGGNWESGLLMKSGYQELTKVLQTFRLGYPGHDTLLLESILMHMHASVDEIQLFCGFEGQEESKRVIPAIREWAKSETARHAVWYAGQVIRAAKSLHVYHLRDFQAASVFHAGVVLWAYAIAADRYDSPGGMQNMLHQQPAKVTVCLDDEQAPELQRFIALARGHPGLRGMRTDGEPILLKDAAGVMDLILGIFEANHKHNGLKPPLVDKVMQMLETLRDIAKRYGMGIGVHG